jgi:hypothetical protein
MKGINLLLLLALSCASKEVLHVEAGPGLILPPVMQCVRDWDDTRTGVFRFSYIAGSEGHAKDIRILKTPFRRKRINACMSAVIRAERIPVFPNDRKFVQELYFER